MRAMDRRLLLCVCFTLAGLSAETAFAQLFGVDAHNTLMPASGGMAGASLALPQDATSGINGNPATLTQFDGTHFVFGGAWAEPTLNLTHAGGVLPNVGAFSDKSHAPGGGMPNVGVTQDLSALGMPATMGMALVGSGGGSVDFRNVPESNGTSAGLIVLEITNAFAYRVTDEFSVGASVSAGSSFIDVGFVGLSAMVPAYGIRGTFGGTYELNPCTTLGLYYQTKQHYKFDSAILLDLGPGNGFSRAFDVRMDLPSNIGFGIANHALMDGQLLLAADVLYKNWSDAAMFGSLYRDQWVFQFGSQYSMGRYRLRMGYAYAENAMNPNPGPSAGGVTPPGLQSAIQYFQAQMPAINPHRLTAGVGIVDFMPNVDLDVNAGGMFRNTVDLGPSTQVSLESYWIGFGMTWHYGCNHREVCSE